MKIRYVSFHWKFSVSFWVTSALITKWCEEVDEGVLKTVLECLILQTGALEMMCLHGYNVYSVTEVSGFQMMSNGERDTKMMQRHFLEKKKNTRCFRSSLYCYFCKAPVSTWQNYFCMGMFICNFQETSKEKQQGLAQ